MLSALGDVLPIGVAMAVSTVPITAALLILLSPRRARSGVPFMLGWVVGIAAVVLLAAQAAMALPVSSKREQHTAIAIAELVVGGGLIALAVAAWHRATTTRPPSGGSRLDAIGSFGPLAAFGVGFAMGWRPKALLLGVAAGLAIAGQTLPRAGRAFTVAVYVAVSASTVAIPVILAVTAPARMEPRLLAAHDWLNQHGSVVVAAIMMMIGVVILGTGLSSL